MAAAPSVSVEAAEVGFTSAEAKGTIDPGGEGASYHYEYITDAKYNENLGNGNPGFQGAEFAGFNFIAAAGPAEPAVLTLAAGTAYRLRLVAENGGGETSSVTAFTTQSATAAPVTIDPVGVPSYTRVHVSGTVNPEGGNVNPIGPTPVPIAWEFQVNREGQGWEFASGTPVGGSQVIEGAAAESASPIAVEEEIEGLVPGATYEIRLRSVRAGAEAISAEPFESFQTLSVSTPSVTATTASSITASSAILNGEVTAGGTDSAFDSPCHFEYISEPAFQKNTAESKPGFEGAAQAPCNATPQGTSATPVEAEAAGLEPHQAYRFRLAATNAAGTAIDDAPATFATVAVQPNVQTTSATGVSGTEATLRGWVNPNNDPTTYYFLWGSQDCSANPCQSVPVSQDADGGAGNQVIGAQQTITGLAPETTYHFLLVAENSAGTSEGADRTFTTNAIGSEGECTNEARRLEQRATVLSDCRAWEMASPADKNGSDVMVNTNRTHAARTESPGLPMAATFASLGAFGDAIGIGRFVEYLTERDATPGTSGWSTHAITPAQEPLSIVATVNIPPFYEGEMSADLTHGVFRAWSPLTADPNVQNVVNEYVRPDLRTPGAGTYQLVTPASSPLSPITNGRQRPFFGGASEDFEHVVFDSKLNLTPDASGSNSKLYKSDAGVLRLITDGSGTCPPEGSATPCSGGGVGLSLELSNERVISADGSRVNFSAPLESGGVSTAAGQVSRLYQFDDSGTASAADDVTIQLNASEKAIPDGAQPAKYQTASVDGSRVFFLSTEQLTETPGSGFYMWERQEDDESQSVTVDASGGTFTLTAQRQPTAGSGTLTNGSSTVSGVSGSFTTGQTVSGPGIPAGTTVTRVGSGEIELSAPATADGPVTLDASVQRTTAPLDWDAPAAQVEVALETLDIVGSGNVEVSGGPGGTTPYTVTFVGGGLAGVNVGPLSADASGLSGGGASATVATTNPVHNLTLIGNGGDVVLGASEDGHRAYFSADGQLVPGAPPSSLSRGVFAWQDADGTPGGTLSFVGSMDANVSGLGRPWASRTGRVTPDGKHLLFRAGEGNGLAPAYPHGTCTSNLGPFGCPEFYLYSAEGSTPTDPDLVCVSCDLGNPASPYDVQITTLRFSGATPVTNYDNHPVSNDGRHVFFSTDEPLAAEDTNGTWDAYEYDTQTRQWHLLSSGTDPDPSYFMDTSASGEDAFFVTRARLVGWDNDAAYDLYDARVGGGFPEPPAPNTEPCQGESCKGQSGPAPAVGAMGSATVESAGNPKSTKRCPRGKRATKARGGKSRCVTKHRKRHAKSNRRAGR